jgi:phage shock protein A
MTARARHITDRGMEMTESLRYRVSQILDGNFSGPQNENGDGTTQAKAEQILPSVNRILGEVRQELGVVTANRYLAQCHRAELKRRQAEFTRSAEKAISLGRDDWARVALARQLDIEARIMVTESNLRQLTAQEKELSGQVRMLMSRRQELEDLLSQHGASQECGQAAGGPCSMAETELLRRPDTGPSASAPAKVPAKSRNRRNKPAQSPDPGHGVENLAYRRCSDTAKT